MKVIFLDFDGVLNSRASFIMEDKRRVGMRRVQKEEIGPVHESLCHVCCSNFQMVLEHFREVKIVISSTWREIYDLDWLRNKLNSYGIDGSRVIDKTPATIGGERGREIDMWLSEHPEVTKFVIIDDNHIGGRFNEEIVFTTWNVGFTLDHACKVATVLNPKSKLNLKWED